jgi:hypothetical protein
MQNHKQNLIYPSANAMNPMLDVKVNPPMQVQRCWPLETRWRCPKTPLNKKREQQEQTLQIRTADRLMQLRSQKTRPQRYRGE